jgi:hypothetical protein
MWESLHRHCADFTLTCFCFDNDAKTVMDGLHLPGVTTVALAELEAGDPDLLAVKNERSPLEYCWTATPALLLHAFREQSQTELVTYLDADLLFFDDPELLFEEIGDASVCITPHRYAPAYAHQAINGIYCVQWVTFRRDDNGVRALQWWHDRCIEWCYYRLEDGKLGDQKYLDDWPERFEGVHVLRHKGGGLAPWNVSRYQLRRERDRVLVDEDPLVFFHYHRYTIRAAGGDDWQPPGYPITPEQYDLLYRPYTSELEAAKQLVHTVSPGFSGGLAAQPPLRQRLAASRANLAQRAVSHAPWLLRARYPRRWRELRDQAQRSEP